MTNFHPSLKKDHHRTRYIFKLKISFLFSSRGRKMINQRERRLVSDLDFMEMRISREWCAQTWPLTATTRYNRVSNRNDGIFELRRKRPFSLTRFRRYLLARPRNEIVAQLALSSPTPTSLRISPSIRSRLIAPSVSFLPTYPSSPCVSNLYSLHLLFSRSSNAVNESNRFN